MRHDPIGNGYGAELTSYTLGRSAYDGQRGFICIGVVKRDKVPLFCRDSEGAANKIIALPRCVFSAEVIPYSRGTCLICVGEQEIRVCLAVFQRFEAV